jgi:hypothetical protein
LLIIIKDQLVNNKKTEATSRAKGVCPICHSEMRGYAGPLKINHWKHISIANCDKWFETETKWHRGWKNKFPSEWQEIIVEAGTVKHIADVFNPNKELVIEFQNSPISIDDLNQREVFYNKMIWVVNTIPFKKNITLDKNWHSSFSERIIKPIERRFNSYGKSFWNIHNVLMKTYTHKQDGISGFAKHQLQHFLSSLEIKKDEECFNLIWELLDPLISYDLMRTKVTNIIEDLIFKDTGYSESKKILNEVYELNNRFLEKFGSSVFKYPKSKKDYFFFDWKHQHKHWNFAKNPIFLDTGNKNIYMVIENWEYGSGFIVKRFFKSDFLNHYLQ